ncbi:hypothetical protein ACFX13_034645 [Malus domestica]
MGVLLSNLTEGTNGSSHGPGFGNIPESCVACVFTYLTPPEICNLVRLNKAFRGAASSDSAWESKLPLNYHDLLDLVPLQRYQNCSKKDIFAILELGRTAIPMFLKSLSTAKPKPPRNFKTLRTPQPHHRAMVFLRHLCLRFDWKLPDHPKLPKGKVIGLIVLDGWGEANADQYNCIHVAETPVMDSLKKGAPERWRLVRAHGTAVGLPTEDDMGNNEMGHNALGAGLIFAQGAGVQ